MVAYAL
jgi:hypothetical protein